MTNVLAAILAAKEREIASLAGSQPSVRAGPPRAKSVLAGLVRRHDEPLRLITEIKRRSPSAGALSTRLSVAERAVTYGRSGAAMISVLCDVGFFDGSWEHVTEARRALDDAGLAVPLLAKEFILHDRQIEQAVAAGADAVLLIVRIVSRARLAGLVKHARWLGLEPLVEVVTEEELRAALDADAKIIGVNARDLDTLVMDADRAARVLAAIPRDRIAVHLSGLKTPADVCALARTDVDAALMGEALMREDDPTELLGAIFAATAG